MSAAVGLPEELAATYRGSGQATAVKRVSKLLERGENLHQR